MFSLSYINGQSHKVGQANYNCKLNKKGWFFNSEKFPCPACEAVEKKEELAKKVENKRRGDIAKAKAEADKIANEIASKKELAEQIEKNKVTEVFVKMPKTDIVEQKIENKKTEPQILGNRFMSGGGSYFYIENDDNSTSKIIPATDALALEIKKSYGTWKVKGKSVARFLHPAETGVILYESKAEYCNGWYIHYYDIVDFDLKPLFSDKSIHHIEHFYENWFLIGYYPCESYKGSSNIAWFKSLKLYNVKTKKFIDVNIDDTFDYLRLHDTHSLNHDGIGDLVFHNRFFESGEYNTESENFSDMKHGGYELLIDNLAGGNDRWKAAVCISVNKSLNDYYYKIYMIKDNNEFEIFTVDSNEFKTYFDK